jgi:hypothetical protein
MPNTNHYVGYKYDFTYFVGHIKFITFWWSWKLGTNIQFWHGRGWVKKVKK